MSKTPLSVAALVAALACTLPATALAAKRTKPRTVAVDVKIDRFGMRQGRPVAYATASTVAYTRHGKVRRSRQRTTLAVTSGRGGCTILTLHLEELKLTLLGLTVDTSAVNLRITGQRGGTLGKLFCQLASGLELRNKARAAAATRGLNRHMRHRKLRAMSFRAVVAPKARASQSQPTCPVLHLTLGPLNLNLLGLHVDLYGPTRRDPITVSIVADPNGGVLGSLFCQLAGEAQAQAQSTA